MGRLTPLCRGFERKGYICQPLLQVHDELLFLVSEDLVPLAGPLFREIMVECGQLRVPVEVDYAVGRTWADL